MAIFERVTLMRTGGRILSSVSLIRESKVGMVGAFLVGSWILVAIFAPWLSPHEPNATLVPFLKPGGVGPDGTKFILGTDHIGRDILSRIIWGSTNRSILRAISHHQCLCPRHRYGVGRWLLSRLG